MRLYTGKNSKTKMGELVLKYRELANISQLKLSQELGFLSTNRGQFISNVERGQIGLPPSKFNAFCRTTNCPMDEIIEAFILDIRESIKKHINIEDNNVFKAE